MRDIKLPMSKEDAKSLKLGEMITVSGLLFTGRSRLHIRAVEDNIYPPIDYEKINCFFHVGPVMKQNGDEWEVVSCEPTSSIRFERYGADVVKKFNLRTLIGKTTMGPRTAQALKETGGKTECTWIYEVENFGPFFVAIDADGNNYFEELAREADAKMPEIEKTLGIPEDYTYTEVNG